MTDEYNEFIEAQDTPEGSVAAIAVQVIGELNRMLLLGLPHDDQSLRMVQGAAAFLTSVLDGRCANPVGLAAGFVAACQVVDRSILDEMDRAQHYVTELAQAAKLSESKALLNEQYAEFYLLLRDSRNSPIVAGKFDPDAGEHSFDVYQGEELDEAIEDFLHPEEASVNDVPDLVEGPLFDSFDDDVIF